MTDKGLTDLKFKFEALTKGAYLDILIPKSSDDNVSKLLHDGTPEELARLPARRNLYFGRSITSCYASLLRLT